MSEQDLPLEVRRETLPATTEQSPMSILAQMGRDKADAEAMAIVADLVWKQEDREAEREMARDFAAFKRDCPEIRKSSEVDTVTKSGVKIHFFFAPLDAIERVVNPILLKHRITYAWDAVPLDGKMMVTCILTHENGKQRRATFPGPMEGGMGTMSPSQKHASSMTYGRRQSLVAALGIGHADTDTDSLDPLSDEPLNEEQIRTLIGLVEAVGQDETRFLAWATGKEDGKYEDIRMDKYAKGLEMLERKRAGS